MYYRCYYVIEVDVGTGGSDREAKRIRKVEMKIGRRFRQGCDARVQGHASDRQRLLTLLILATPRDALNESKKGRVSFSYLQFRFRKVSITRTRKHDRPFSSSSSPAAHSYIPLVFQLPHTKPRSLSSLSPFPLPASRPLSQVPSSLVKLMYVSEYRRGIQVKASQNPRE